MPWRYNGRMHVNPSAPRASGCCDRCNIVYPLSSLKFQYQWRGVELTNTGFRVCPECYDVPSAFLKAILIPADPLPVYQPRPNQFVAQMNNASPVLVWDIADGRWDDSDGSGTPHSVWL